MSRKAKGIFMEKVIEQFEQADIDEKIRAFEELSQYMSKAIANRRLEIQDEHSKLDALQQKITTP